MTRYTVSMLDNGQAIITTYVSAVVGERVASTVICPSAADASLMVCELLAERYDANARTTEAVSELLSWLEGGAS